MVQVDHLILILASTIVVIPILYTMWKDENK